jgi:putative methyltransferase (TIGR04325 family)
MTVTQILKPILPPFLWSIGKDLKRRLLRSVDHYAHAPQGWHTPLPSGAGNEVYWSAFVERERVLCHALIARVRAGHSILTPEDEVVKYLTFGYVLALAARHKDRLTVIDYGGHLGECYWIATALLPGIELEYHCKELPAIAAAGRELTPGVIWHTDDACLNASYDVVMFSASLPYLRDWKRILSQAAQSTRGYLLLSDNPSVRNVPSYVITQRSGGVVNLQILLNRSEIIDTVERTGLRLVRELTIGTHPPVANAPEQPVSLGWLFRR